MTPAQAAQTLRSALRAAFKAKGANLTEEEWLSEAVAVLTPILTLPKRQKAVNGGFSMGAGLSDEQWLIEIGAQPAFSGLNVRQEVESCRVWSATNNCQPTRRRIVNWLLRALRDRPLSNGNQGRFAGQAPLPGSQQVEPEPLNWREEFPDYVRKGEPWHTLPADHRAHFCREMAKLAQKEA